MSSTSARSTILLTAALVAIYWSLETLLFRHAVLDEAAYERFALVGSLAMSSGVIALLATIALALVARPALRGSWSRLAAGSALRALAVAAIAVLVLDQAFAPENPYFARSYALDRVLLAAFGAAALWRPAFLAAFLPLAFALAGQKTHPLDAFIWAFDLLPLRVLSVCLVAHLVEGITGRRASREGLVLIVAIVASQYFYPGILKLNLSWPYHEHLENLLFGARSAGWLSWVSTDTLLALAERIDQVNPYLVIAVLGLELYAAFCLYGRRTLCVFLVFWLIFHAGIFLLIGYCFWKWLAIEATLLVLVVRGIERPRSEERGSASRTAFFTYSRYLVAMLLIATAAWWSPPADLAWIDTRLSHSFHFEFETESGARGELPPSWFGPYQDQITMGLFGYLTREPLLTGTYGVTHSRDVAKRLEGADSVELVRRLEEERGQVRYDASRADRFRVFLRRVIVHRAGSPAAGFQIPSFWTARGTSSPPDDPVRRIRVELVKWLYDGKSFREIERRAVLEVPPSASP